MSASRSPTVYPMRAREIARFTAIVVFPTPPFPEATAIIFDTLAKTVGGFSCSFPTITLG